MADRTFIPGTNTYTFDDGGQDQVFPNVPHPITQRGNGRENVFFCDDKALY
jgi:hypothetical protein